MDQTSPPFVNLWGFEVKPANHAYISMAWKRLPGTLSDNVHLAAVAMIVTAVNCALKTYFTLPSVSRPSHQHW